MRTVAVWLMGFTWAIGGCAAAPVAVPLPQGHPADPASQESLFVPPSNPFTNALPAGRERDPSPASPHPEHGGHRP